LIRKQMKSKTITLTENQFDLLESMIAENEELFSNGSDHELGGELMDNIYIQLQEIFSRF